MISSPIIILGAGLSGLTTAYQLQKAGKAFLILEARERYGGRMHTIKGTKETTLEMGATWFGKKHVYLNRLLDELGLDYFPQYNQGIALFETMSFTPPQAFQIPASEEPSYRISGGSSRLIDRLVEKIGAKNIKTGVEIKSITDEGEQLKLTDTKGESFLAQSVISTLPPVLFVSSILCDPVLPEHLTKVAKQTQTWMADSVKFAVEYEKAFWREQGFAGTVFSQSSISPELYDHCDVEVKTFALKGFLGGLANQLDQDQRKEKVLVQLTKMFGPSAKDYTSYHDRIWSREAYTYTPYENFVLPHQYNGHSVYQETYLNGRLLLSGTETSPVFGGYMDGAVYSGERAAKLLITDKAKF